MKENIYGRSRPRQMEKSNHAIRYVAASEKRLQIVQIVTTTPKRF